MTCMSCGQEKVSHQVITPSDGGEIQSVKTIAATEKFPPPRVGSASTSLKGKIYMFSGRGGPSMSPIDEHGSVWEFNPSTSTWSTLSPWDSAVPQPAARSYHSLTSDAQDNLYLHAGCPEKGRLSDLWTFSVSKREWRQLESAPRSGRGGTSIAHGPDFLYRMHGFDDQKEQGGSLDMYSIANNSWQTYQYKPDGISGPTPRSVSTLLRVSIKGRPSLVTAFGEVDPSVEGHQGAGKMSNEVWIYDIQTTTWSRVKVNEAEGSESKPCGRGWLAADVLRGPDPEQVLFHGGLGESKQRLGDVWVLSF
jgi:Galactose oxidase, central domain